MNITSKIYKFVIHLLAIFIPLKIWRKNFRYFFLNAIFSSVKIDKGFNNKFSVFDDSYNETQLKSIKNLEIKFLGNNNEVKIHKDVLLGKKTRIVCSGNNKIFVDKPMQGKRYNFRFSVDPILAYGCELYIGKNVSIEGATFCLFDEPNLSIKILDNCMLSDNIYFRVSDGHTILNCESNEIINYPKSILINENCWIGHSCRILKGSVVPANSIVAMGSIFTSSSNQNNTENCIYAGIPAKIVKKNVYWKRERADKVK